MASETINYNVLDTFGTVEIRKYDDILLASTKTNPKNVEESGFNRVFKFITGQNERNETINMTSPVISYQEGESLVTGFYVPSKYDKDSVPKPTGEVYINTIESSIYVVITFYGAWTKENYDTHQKQLEKFITDHELKVNSTAFVMRYNAPYVPDEQKRNEIAYQIENYKVKTI